LVGRNGGSSARGGRGPNGTNLMVDELTESRGKKKDPKKGKTKHL